MRRVTETTFFEMQHTVEVRSRPLWVALLEEWFLWVHEFSHHILHLRVPKWLYDDPYWGEPFEAAFHHFYTWTLNHGVEIDQSAAYFDLKLSPRQAETERLWQEQLDRDMDGD